MSTGLRSSLSRFSGPKIIQPSVHGQSNKAQMPLHVTSKDLFDNEDDEGEFEQGIALIKTHRPITTPSSEIGGSTPKMYSVSSTNLDVSRPIKFNVMPSLLGCTESELPHLFTTKCNECCQLCDYYNLEAQIEEKEQKKKILSEILVICQDPNIIASFDDQQYNALYRMWIKNIIRITPKAPDIWFAPTTIDVSGDKVEEAGWEHMALVYDCVIALMSNRKFNQKAGSDGLKQLIEQMVPIFTSPDTRERDRLMKLFHSAYRALGKQRGDLRQECYSFIQKYLTSDFKIVGITDILTASIPIISGYKVPLHQEHLHFFKECILPLHKSPFLLQFHASLVACVLQFVSKYQPLSTRVILTIRDFWPDQSPPKQVAFLLEIEALLGFVTQTAGMEMTKVISKIVADSITNENFSVVERALMLWQNEAFARIVCDNSRTTYMILIPALFRTANYHWNVDVKNLATYALRALKGSDPATFGDVGAKLRQIESERILKEIDSAKKWVQLGDFFCETEELRVANRNSVAKYFIGSEEIANAPPMQIQAQNQLSTISQSAPHMNQPNHVRPLQSRNKVPASGGRGFGAKKLPDLPVPKYQNDFMKYSKKI